MGHGCVLCHSIRGTDAGGRVGPDLTHLASRRTLAAATVPNNRGWLGAWVVDPQGIKPGAHMPANDLRAEELQALLTYLQSLR
jgi:cytochrome c oxidase subunit 2